MTPMSRNLDSMDRDGSKVPRDPYELSDEDRQRVLERARRQLPELDRQYAEATERLNELFANWKGARRANR